MPEQVERFTPAEIKELVASGALTNADIGLLHPADQKVALLALSSQDTTDSGTDGDIMQNALFGREPMSQFHAPEFNMSQAMAVPAAPLVPQALASGSIPAALGIAGRAALPLATGAAGSYIGGTMGHPMAGWLMGMALGGGRNPLGLRGRSGPKPAGPVASPPAYEPPAVSPAATRTSTALETGAGTKPVSGPTGTTTTSTTGSWPSVSQTKPAPPNVTKSSPRGPSGLGGEDLPDQVQRGVQNDFRGRVTFQRGAAPPPRMELPPGATKRTPPDIYRQLEEAYAESQGNPAEVEAIRLFISKALSGGK